MLLVYKPMQHITVLNTVGNCNTMVLEYYNLKGTPLYMRSVVDRKVSMRRMTVIGNMVLENSDFHTRNNLSENNPQIGHALSELFASHVLGRKRISV